MEAKKFFSDGMLKFVLAVLVIVGAIGAIRSGKSRSAGQATQPAPPSQRTAEVAAKPVAVPFAATEAKRTPSPFEAKPIAEAAQGGISFFLYSCQAQGDEVQCYFKVRNDTPDDKNFNVLANWGNSSFLVDDLGEMHKATAAELGGYSRPTTPGLSGQGIRLVPGVPVEGALVFKAPHGIKEAVLLRIAFYTSDPDIIGGDVVAVDFKDIQPSRDSSS